MPLLTTQELAHVLAGGDSYIRTRNGEVIGLALRLDLNPEAPRIIVVGDGSRIINNARLLMDCGRAVPAYVKRGVNAWEYMGEYRATAYRQDADTINLHRHDRPFEKINGILFLEASDKATVSVSGGAFSDPQTRKEVEQAAVAYVTADLESKGYKVEDRQRENCGYDLLATSAKSVLKVEVKGTIGAEPRFYISKNERETSTDKDWRLALVSLATTNPKLAMMTSEQMESGFNFKTLAWECTPIIPAETN